MPPLRGSRRAPGLTETIAHVAIATAAPRRRRRKMRMRRSFFMERSPKSARDSRVRSGGCHPLGRVDVGGTMTLLLAALRRVPEQLPEDRVEDCWIDLSDQAMPDHSVAVEDEEGRRA